MLRAAELLRPLPIEQLKGIDMSSSSPTSLLDVDLQPGRPPMLRVEAAGDAAALGRRAPGRAARRRRRARLASWSAASGCATRRETGAVFQRLAPA